MRLRTQNRTLNLGNACLVMLREKVNSAEKNLRIVMVRTTVQDCLHTYLRI